MLRNNEAAKSKALSNSQEMVPLSMASACGQHGYGAAQEWGNN
jgi:hypothetical protein